MESAGDVAFHIPQEGMLVGVPLTTLLEESAITGSPRCIIGERTLALLDHHLRHGVAPTTDPLERNDNSDEASRARRLLLHSQA